MSQEKDDATLMNSAWNNENLPEQFLEKMKHLKTQREQLALYTADINLLMKRFNVEKSLFGRVASSFASLRWWQKALIGIAIGIVFALIGIPISVPWIIALPIIALVLYAVMVYLFEDYAKSDRNRFAQLSEGIIKREAEMKESVLELQATEMGLHTLIGELNRFGQNYTAVVDCFNEQALQLSEQVQHYQEAVVQFEQLKSAFSEHAQSMKTAETEFSSDLKTVSERLYQEFQRIETNTNEVAKATEHLHEQVNSLRNQSATMQQAEGPLNNSFEEWLEDREEDWDEDAERALQSKSESAKTQAFILDFESFLNQCNKQLSVVATPQRSIGSSLN